MRFKGQNEIDEKADILDSRDIADRIDYLESEIDTIDGRVTEARGRLEEIRVALLTADDEESEELTEEEEGLDQDIADELEEKGPLQTELEELREFYEDIPAQEALIAESYFETYARELADDIGAIDRDAGWPMNCIDWEEAASQLMTDYSSAELRGQTFYFRS